MFQIMNKRNIAEIFLIWLLIFWIMWASELVWDQFINWDICPNISFIPACYIIFWTFISLLLLQVLQVNKYCFYWVAAIPIAIAVYWTFFQLFGTIECPKTNSWIPMCFISLALFSSIVILKVFLSKDPYE